MNTTWKILESFINQVHEGGLTTSNYPKEWKGLTMKLSFGMGQPAKVPWIAFLAEGMSVSKGYYPVYLYYKYQGVLVLAYGISETEDPADTWPADVLGSAETIRSHFNDEVPRYGDSLVFKSYKVDQTDSELKLYDVNSQEKQSAVQVDSDLDVLIKYYQGTLDKSGNYEQDSARKQGLFYMEKQLEDFLIHNWSNTELGKQYDLITQEGELKSQQYPTDIGPIDILAKEKTELDMLLSNLKRIKQVMILSVK